MLDAATCIFFEHLTEVFFSGEGLLGLLQRKVPLRFWCFGFLANLTRSQVNPLNSRPVKNKMIQGEKQVETT